MKLQVSCIQYLFPSLEETYYHSVAFLDGGTLRGRQMAPLCLARDQLNSLSSLPNGREVGVRIWGADDEAPCSFQCVGTPIAAYRCREIPGKS